MSALTNDDLTAFNLYAMAVLGTVMDGSWDRQEAHEHLVMTLRMLASDDPAVGSHMRAIYSPA